VLWVIEFAIAWNVRSASLDTWSLAVPTATGLASFPLLLTHWRNTRCIAPAGD